MTNPDDKRPQKSPLAEIKVETLDTLKPDEAMIVSAQSDGSHSAVKITGIGVEKSPAEVCASDGCNNPLPHEHIPIWKEFKVFGRVWIIGWWGDKIVDSLCWQCRSDQERDHNSQMLEGAYNQGVIDGYREAQDE